MAETAYERFLKDVKDDENIVEGDISSFKIPEKLPEVPIKTIERSKKKVIENESEFEKAFNYGMQKAYERNEKRYEKR